MDDDYGVAMTREAKIGLLVALAFVLVIGILLSDHVTTSNREPAAPLASVEQSIRGGIAAPGVSNEPPVLPPQQTPVAPVTADAGQQPGVPFVYDPNAAAQQGQISIEIGRPDSVPQQPPVQIGGPIAAMWENEPLPGSQEQVQAQQPTPSEPVQPTEQTGPVTIEQLAQQAGEPIIASGGQTESASGKQATVEYEVLKGDSLSKITAKALGRDNPDNRELILSLNPSLRANPNRINIGDKVTVPAGSQEAATLRGETPAVAQAQPTSPATPAAPVQAKVTTESRGKTYTVQSGDSLWSIATDELGDGKRMHDILKLNKDQIDDADAIVVGMTLKLPA